MEQTPKTAADVKEILLKQIGLLQQESEKNPDKLSELTVALCKAVEAYKIVMCYHNK